MSKYLYRLHEKMILIHFIPFLKVLCEQLAEIQTTVKHIIFGSSKICHFLEMDLLADFLFWRICNFWNKFELAAFWFGNFLLSSQYCQNEVIASLMSIWWVTPICLPVLSTDPALGRAPDNLEAVPISVNDTVVNGY